MSDIVEWLRSPCDSDTAYAQRKMAADEIERLKTELDEEEKAVFAAMKMLKERDAEIERLRTLVDQAARWFGDEGNPAAAEHFRANLSWPSRAS